jgi:hypothetical protein
VDHGDALTDSEVDDLVERINGGEQSSTPNPEAQED